MANLVYYYAYNTAGGDIFYGYTFDNGSFGYYDGYYTYGPYTNSGGYWYVEITDVYSGYSNAYHGYNYAYYYYDGETGISTTPYYNSLGYYSTGGIGSGYDYVDLNGNGVLESGEYFDAYHEADYVAPTANLVYYYAYNTAGGDVLYGYTFDDGSFGYYDGYSWYGPLTDSGGYWYVEITDVYSGYSSAYNGLNYVYYYYDGESGIGVTPYYSSYGGYSTGGIGTGYDYADLNGNGVLESGEYFDAYHEADYVAPTANLVYYYAYNTAGGDVLYGYTFDDGSFGYYDGYSWYGPLTDSGGYWYVEITDVYSGYSSAYNGLNYVYYYYDGESGIGVTPYYSSYGGYSTGGIGTGYDYADLNGNGVLESGEYFDAYHEADYVSVGDSLYYFYAYNTSEDYYFGYAIDATGAYEVDDTIWLGTYDNDGGYWQYYIYSAYDLGYVTGYDGYSTVDLSYGYFDAEGGQTYGIEAYYNMDGIGSEYGYLSFGTEELFGYYGYYEADALLI